MTSGSVHAPLECDTEFVARHGLEFAELGCARPPDFALKRCINLRSEPGRVVGTFADHRARATVIAK